MWDASQNKMEPTCLPVSAFVWENWSEITGMRIAYDFESVVNKI